MNPYDLIDAKKRGRRHSREEIQGLVAAVTDGSIPDYQVSAWLMAVWFRGLDDEETTEFTLAMRDSGDVIDLDRLPGPTADKHSTGGVGDKISLLLAPLAAELGMQVPMLSGRGLGHTGGTLDKLTSIPGYRIDLSVDEMLDVVQRVGCSIVGQTERIAPADRRLYALRDVTATVDCVPLIVSSILSKKFAAGPRNLVIDLKCGSGAFMRTPDDARRLARMLVQVATRAGREASALITDMDQPLGEAVGHALEVEEAIAGLSGGGPSATRELTVELTTEMAVLAGLGTADDMRMRARAALDDGSALRRFVTMVEAQGGRLDPAAPSLDVAPEQEPLRAERDGVVASFETEQVGWAVVDLGGGRRTHADDLDRGVGLRVVTHRGEPVERGTPLVRIFARDEETAALARARLARAITLAERADDGLPLIGERVTAADLA
ncbi:MAG TPA: thymidine phosphorylase [Candidatus Krumholzibacteria bacterium]|nr:thymidine phosphorylase [Candidatus Krumholzibacteria bacterium]